jgi:hypothetical protein
VRALGPGKFGEDFLADGKHFHVGDSPSVEVVHDLPPFFAYVDVERPAHALFGGKNDQRHPFRPPLFQPGRTGQEPGKAQTEMHLQELLPASACL